MHERSLVRALLTQVGELLQQHHAPRVASVRVRIGEFSGVEPELFRLAFDDMVQATPFRGASLELKTVDLEARCEECERRFHVPSFRFHCPDCGSTKTAVICGEELLLESVTMEDA